MRKDERLNLSVKVANSLGYVIFWYGIFAVLLYRWFFLDQTFIETLDLFIVWIVASLIQFITLALKGIPMTYPIDMTKKEQKYYTLFVPLFAGTLSVCILFFIRNVTELNRLLGGFLLSAFGTLVMLTLYKTILYYWEKKNT